MAMPRSHADPKLVGPGAGSALAPLAPTADRFALGIERFGISSHGTEASARAFVVARSSRQRDGSELLVGSAQGWASYGSSESR